MAERLPLVLLHGWGFDSRIWDDLIPLLAPSIEVIALDLPGFGNAAADQDVLARLPGRCVLLGWSLGGMLAMHLASKYPERVAGLITVGSNLKWVSQDRFENKEWPGASADNFAAFFENVAQDFEGTKKHFCSVIARGDAHEKQLIKQLKEKLSGASRENFLAGLRLLDSIDNRGVYAQLRMPGLHIFGEKDALVPLAVEQQMRALNGKQQTQVMAGCAHAPFLTQPGQFVSAVSNFVQSLPYRLDKKHIAASFSKAAATYDRSAQLQRTVGDKLLSYLPLELVAERILDVGCGTGVFTSQLKMENPESLVTGFDLAPGMLQLLKSRDPSVALACGDAEQLPFAAGSIDVLFSNLAIQWCQDYPRLFAEWRRVLADDGVCLISTFVDGTLQELKEAWQAVDQHVHINHFVSADELCRAARAQGFSHVECEQQTEIAYFRSVRGLMRELKDIGAHNLNAGRHSGLTGRGQLARLTRAYELKRDQQQLPATWRVAYLVLQKQSSGN